VCLGSNQCRRWRVKMDLLGSVVAANPCLPLPLQITRIDKHTGKQIVGFANTHHVLMQAYQHAINRNNIKDNAVRENTQIELTHIFIKAFTNPNRDPKALYEAATTFTRAYLHSFMPARSVPDARFAPYEDIAFDTYAKNTIVAAACEHLAGMIFYDEDGVRSYQEVLADLKNLRFSEILDKYAEVHTARSVDVPTLVEVVD
jgi:hypothetical protein